MGSVGNDSGWVGNSDKCVLACVPTFSQSEALPREDGCEIAKVLQLQFFFLTFFFV